MRIFYGYDEQYYITKGIQHTKVKQPLQNDKNFLLNAKMSISEAGMIRTRTDFMLFSNDH